MTVQYYIGALESTRNMEAANIRSVKESTAPNPEASPSRESNPVQRAPNTQVHPASRGRSPRSSPVDEGALSSSRWVQPTVKGRKVAS